MHASFIVLPAQTCGVPHPRFRFPHSYVPAQSQVALPSTSSHAAPTPLPNPTRNPLSQHHYQRPSRPSDSHASSSSSPPTPPIDLQVYESHQGKPKFSMPAHFPTRQRSAPTTCTTPQPYLTLPPTPNYHKNPIEKPYHLHRPQTEREKRRRRRKKERKKERKKGNK